MSQQIYCGICNQSPEFCVCSPIHSNEAIVESKDALIRQLSGALYLILPLAKGYVANNKVGSNAIYLAEAEKALAAAKEQGYE